MNNPRNNLTTSERSLQGRHYSHTIGVDLIDDRGRKSRFWFQDLSDAQAFVRVFKRAELDPGTIPALGQGQVGRTA